MKKCVCVTMKIIIITRRHHSNQQSDQLFYQKKNQEMSNEQVKIDLMIMRWPINENNYLLYLMMTKLEKKTENKRKKVMTSVSPRFVLDIRWQIDNIET